VARKVNLSQLQSLVRQAQQKQKQAINQYNQAVRRHNQNVQQAINKYNQEVRAYNSLVRSHRQRIKSELTKLGRQSITTHYVVFRSSVRTMHEAYLQLEKRTDFIQATPYHEQILDLSGKETANSLRVLNYLLGTTLPDSAQETATDLQTVLVTDQLRKISDDLDNRWGGAVFSLNPQNPDAARHFCTSVREIFTQIIDIVAPDLRVTEIFPECQTTDQGKPTRRSKIKFILHRKEMADRTLEEFVEQDMENIVQLFTVLNEGTHGSAGKLDLYQLASIKKRVEDGIIFLSQLVN
jgi:hypothetical protein